MSMAVYQNLPLNICSWNIASSSRLASHLKLNPVSEHYFSEQVSKSSFWMIFWATVEKTLEPTFPVHHLKNNLLLLYNQQTLKFHRLLICDAVICVIINTVHTRISSYSSAITEDWNACAFSKLVSCHSVWVTVWPSELQSHLLRKVRNPWVNTSQTDNLRENARWQWSLLSYDCYIHIDLRSALEPVWWVRSGLC